MSYGFFGGEKLKYRQAIEKLQRYSSLKLENIKVEEYLPTNRCYMFRKWKSI